MDDKLRCVSSACILGDTSHLMTMRRLLMDLARSNLGLCVSPKATLKSEINGESVQAEGGAGGTGSDITALSVLSHTF